MFVENLWLKTYHIVMQDITSKSTNKEITIHIAQKIVALRRALDLTQEEFAEKIDLSTRAISRAEGGRYRATLGTLEKICRKFDVPLAYFFDNSIYSMNNKKEAIIKEINSELNILPIEKIVKIKRILEIIK